jgi:hypothetical protein
MIRAGKHVVIAPSIVHLSLEQLFVRSCCAAQPGSKELSQMRFIGRDEPI